MSRSRTSLLIAVMATLALFAAGCKQPDNTPQTYDDLTQSNFVHGCTGEGSGTNLASTDACQCAYDWMTNNVPASNADKEARPDKFANYDGPTFQQLNSSLKSDPSSMPANIQQGLATACKSHGWSATTSTTSGSGSGGGPTTIG